MSSGSLVFLIVPAVAIGLGRFVGAEVLDCLIEPHDVVNVSSPVDGVLEKVQVKRGDLVKKGQVLARLESSVERAALAFAQARARAKAAIQSAETRVEFNKERFARRQSLFAKDLIPLDELQESETENRLAGMALLEASENQRLAQLELKRAKAALARRTVRSPLTGVVVKRFLSPGEYTSGETANDKTSIVKIAQLDPVRVEVFAPLSLLGRVAVGIQAKVVIEEPLGTVHMARVTTVDRVVDSASGTFGIRLEMPNPDYQIPPGVRCKVELPQGES